MRVGQVALRLTLARKCAAGATRGGRSIDAQSVLKGHKLRTRSLTTTDGDPRVNSFVVARCARAALELGELLVVSFGAPQVLEHGGIERAVEVLEALEYFTDPRQVRPQLPEQLPLLSAIAMDAYASTATSVPPSKFEGVMLYDQFKMLVASSMADLSVDASRPPVHIAIVESWPAAGGGASSSAGAPRLALVSCIVAHTPSLSPRVRWAPLLPRGVAHGPVPRTCASGPGRRRSRNAARRGGGSRGGGR